MLLVGDVPIQPRLRHYAIIGYFRAAEGFVSDHGTPLRMAQHGPNESDCGYSVHVNSFLCHT